MIFGSPAETRSLIGVHVGSDDLLRQQADGRRHVLAGDLYDHRRQDPECVRPGQGKGA